VGGAEGKEPTRTARGLTNRTARDMMTRKRKRVRTRQRAIMNDFLRALARPSYSFSFQKGLIMLLSHMNSINCRLGVADTRSETPSEFVVPSLWRTCPNLIGPFIHPTAPQTRSVARRAMPQSHVAPHHLVCSRAQLTRVICQCRLLNE